MSAKFNKTKQHGHPTTVQEIIACLNNYWANLGCVIMQPMDIEVGAGTFHNATFLMSIGPEPWYAAYTQPSRRPTDGRFGENPNRLQKYLQYQVILKPSPNNIQDLYLNSLYMLGINKLVHDIRFVEDNWESPSIGATGLGWEIWIDGMEVTQFTYFQQTGGLPCSPVCGEITYGIERIAMTLLKANNIFDLVYAQSNFGVITYGDLYEQSEKEMSKYNFEIANTEFLLNMFSHHEQEVSTLLEMKLTIPAYESFLKANHTFNLLEARKSISVTQRQNYILLLRSLANKIALLYFDQRKALNFPRCKKV